MIEKSTNKMLGTIEDSVEKVIKQSYFFPDYQITILAGSIEEAEEKLSEKINKK